jgi:hypothetical protein
MARSAVESNRCFFLHLGIALNIHPFALQVACRHLAKQLLGETQADDYSLRADILPSVLGYAHFVDANALIWLWLREFGPYRICMLSGTPAQVGVQCVCVCVCCQVLCAGGCTAHVPP